ncbi:MAG TPA: DUF721 domain-containing protein [Armatimonadota bacterium]|jgi:hypothetical protein
MRPGFTTLSGLINEGLKHYHLEQGVKAAQAVNVWDRVAGPAVASVTRADIVRDGVLWVFTPSSAWSQELSMLRPNLIAGINAAIGIEAVTDIRFRVKRLPTRRPDEPAPDRLPKTLTADERKLVADLAARLEPDAGAVIGGLAERMMARPDRSGICPVCSGPMDPGRDRCPFCSR